MGEEADKFMVASFQATRGELAKTRKALRDTEERLALANGVIASIPSTGKKTVEAKVTKTKDTKTKIREVTVEEPDDDDRDADDDDETDVDADAVDKSLPVRPRKPRGETANAGPSASLVRMIDQAIQVQGLSGERAAKFRRAALSDQGLSDVSDAPSDALTIDLPAEPGDMGELTIDAATMHHMRGFARAVATTGSAFAPSPGKRTKAQRETAELDAEANAPVIAMGPWSETAPR